MTRRLGPEPPGTVIGLEPRRLSEGDSSAAEPSRVFAAATAAVDIDEAAAWRRLAVRLPPQTVSRWRGWRWRTAGLTLVVGTAVAAMLLLPRAPNDERRRRPATTTAALPASAPAPAPDSVPVASPAPRLVLSATEQRLPVGEVELDGEGRVELELGGSAIASTDAGDTQVSLARGALRLNVKTSERGRRFVVKAGPYRFVVAGASFRVVRSTKNVDLWVFEGHVVVWRAEFRGPTMAAGDHWAGPLLEPTKSAPALQSSGLVVDATAAQPARSEALTPCEAAAGGGRTREALDCYRRIGAGTDLGAELALYEAARLELRVTGDVRRALETLDAYARRFPRGTLRSEVDVTRVELLPRVGDYAGALELSERLLREHPEHERRNELRLLRGNIFREALGDCQKAEPEYLSAIAGAGRTADDAEFYRAVCLELLRRPAEAASGYRAYLTRAQPAHRAEAQRRLATLKP